VVDATDVVCGIVVVDSRTEVVAGVVVNIVLVKDDVEEVAETVEPIKWLKKLTMACQKEPNMEKV
jgi:hypothetical protein